MAPLYILLSLLIFGCLIFIHELGHFLVAKLCGVRILEFSIGMGPKLFSVTSKKSGTAYSLRLFPIGGYVSMYGENGMELAQGSNGTDASPDGGNSVEKTAGNSEKDFFVTRTEPTPVETALPDGKTENRKDPHAYCNQSVWKRILISVAGPLMNILLGFALTLVMVFASGAGAVGTTEVAGFHVVYNAEESVQGFQKGDYLDTLKDGEKKVRIDSYASFLAMLENGPIDVYVTRFNEDQTDTVNVLLENVSLTAEDADRLFVHSVSEESGLKPYDVVTKVNGTPVHTYYELAYEIMNQGYRPMKFVVLRDGEKITLDVAVPNFTDSGVTFGELDFLVYREPDFNFPTVAKHAFFRSVSSVKMVFDSLTGLFTGRFGVEAVSGPVGITKTISDAAATGWLNVLYIVIVISINLGVMNLLPLPALDGGHILLYIIEVFRGKPMKKEVEGIINLVGLLLMFALAILVAIKDVIQL